MIGMLAAYAFIHGRAGETWGTSSPGGAINATLVSSAPALPLPSDQKPTENVLATDKPSPAPAPPAPPVPKAAPIPDEKSIPIPAKPEKIKPVAAKEEAKQPARPTIVPPIRPPARPQPAPRQDYRAQYGEAAPTHMARATPGTTGASSPVAVTGGDFGARFGWYVNIIKTKVAQSWLTPLVDPRTPVGSEVKITFVLDRSGSPSQARLSQPSSSPTLNQSAMQAIQRVDTFGSLPPGYNESTLSVEYTSPTRAINGGSRSVEKTLSPSGIPSTSENFTAVGMWRRLQEAQREIRHPVNDSWVHTEGVLFPLHSCGTALLGTSACAGAGLGQDWNQPGRLTHPAGGR